MFLALRTPGSRENMMSPEQSGLTTPQYWARSVDVVNTPYFTRIEPARGLHDLMASEEGPSVTAHTICARTCRPAGGKVAIGEAEEWLPTRGQSLVPKRQRDIPPNVEAADLSGRQQPDLELGRNSLKGTQAG